MLSLGGTGQGQISSQTHTNTRANSSDFFGLIHRTHAFWMLMTLGLHAHAQFVFCGGDDQNKIERQTLASRHVWRHPNAPFELELTNIVSSLRTTHTHQT